MEYRNYSIQELELYRREMLKQFLPAICIMAVLGTFGIVGNIVAILFYTRECKRNTTTTLISFLAVMDTIVCFLIIPNIVEMAMNVSNDQRVVCKIVHALGIGSIGSSVFSLMLIAIDRHNKCCRPFKTQLTNKFVKNAMIGTVFVFFCSGLRNLFTFDTISVEVEQDSGELLNGTYCTASDQSNFKIIGFVFITVDLVIVMAVWVSIVICYSLIIVRVVKLRRKRNRKAEQNVKKAEDAKTNSDNELRLQNLTETVDRSIYKKCKGIYIEEADFNDLRMNVNIAHKALSQEIDAVAHLANLDKNTPELSNSATKEPVSMSETVEPDNKTNMQQPQPNKKSKRWSKQTSNTTSGISARELRLTFMMLTVSIVFILCFLPYFGIRIMARFVFNTGEEFELGLLNQIALRLPYLNSVFNPFIYLLFNREFRAFVWTPIRICISSLRPDTMNV